jgi:hypothetical protein
MKLLFMLLSFCWVQIFSELYIQTNKICVLSKRDREQVERKAKL